MDYSHTDTDPATLQQTPPMSHSMVEREMKRVIQVLEELGSTPLIDTRQPTLIDLSVSGSASEEDADRMPRRLFPSPEQPTRREPSAHSDSGEWLISLVSPAPKARSNASIIPTGTNLRTALLKGMVDNSGVVTDLLTSLPSDKAKRDLPRLPSFLEADDGSSLAATPDLLLTQESPVIGEKAAELDLYTDERCQGVANAETTFAVPSAHLASFAAAAPEKATSDTEAADMAVAPEHGTVASMPVGHLNAVTPDFPLPATRESPAVHKEPAAVDSCDSVEELAVDNADTTFSIPAISPVPAMAAAGGKGTAGTTAADTTVTYLVERPDSAMPDLPLAATQEPAAVQEEAAALDTCASEEGFAVADAETTFAMPAARPTAAAPKKATAAPADTTMTQRQSVIPRMPKGQALPRRSVLPPPSQRSGRLSVPCRLTGPRGRPSVASAAPDTTFEMTKATTAEKRLSAPKGTLQTSQRQSAPVSKPAMAVPSSRMPSVRRSVAGPLGGVAGASRRSLQAPAVGASVSDTTKRVSAPRRSLAPEALAAERTLRPSAASRTSLRPPAKPAATSLRKSAAGPQQPGASACQSTLGTAKQPPKPTSQPQPKPKVAVASQLPRSRLPPPRTRVSGGLPRPTAFSGALSNRALPPLHPIVESPEPARLSSTPVRSDLPVCACPDLTPIRKH